MNIALDTDGLDALPQLNMSGALIAAIAAAIVVAIALVVVAVLLSRPRRPKPVQPVGVHAKLGPRDIWKQRVQKVVDNFNNGDIDREEAFALFAGVAREFASVASGTPVTSKTLLDINRSGPAIGSSRTQKSSTSISQENWTLFRQTIAALYPPEFADHEHHPIAKNASVDEAADWVLKLIEKWR